MPTPRPSDPYRVLGVGRDATLNEIKSAHRGLAKRYHPDAAGGDTGRFLAVQEAYQVLSNPLLRRDWDAKHAPGPVRAEGPASGTAPSRTARPADRAERGEPARARAPRPRPRRRGPEPWAGAERDPTTDSYTWSARHVPWWEGETMPPPGRRQQPGRKRPHAAPRPEPSAPEAGPMPHATAGPPSEFEVFNRSSGAAWSSAARAYYRRTTADMASGAAEPFAARWTTPPGTSPRRSTPPSRPPAVRQTEAARPFRPRPVTPSTGALFGELRSRAGTRTAAWPTLTERLVYATLGWLPLTLLVAYGGGAVTGCGEAAARCPSIVPPLQAASIGLLLFTLALVPKVAYLATAGGVGLVASALLVLLAGSAFGVGAPVRPAVAAIAALVMALAYVAGVALASRDRPILRPWRRYVVDRPGSRA